MQIEKEEEDVKGHFKVLFQNLTGETRKTTKAAVRISVFLSQLESAAKTGAFSVLTLCCVI